MYTTHHGVERVLGRTNMVVEDVLKLIDAGAFVPLGAYKKQEYLLFYSPFDRKCKIALVAGRREFLVSVWEANYFLPDGIIRPGRKLKKLARTLLEDYILSRSKVGTVSPEVVGQTFVPQLYDAKILVYQNSKLEFAQPCPEKVEAYEDHMRYVDRLRAEFEAITDLVERHRTGMVHYLVLLVCPDGTERRSYRLKHSTVLRCLSKPPAETVT